MMRAATPGGQTLRKVPAAKLKDSSLQASRDIQRLSSAGSVPPRDKSAQY